MTRHQTLTTAYTIAIAAMLLLAWYAGTTAHYQPPTPCPPTAIPSQYLPHIDCRTAQP
jgi:hypothetical protein